MVKQLSVFVENKPGRLMEILGALADSKIDIKALSLADTTEFGIIRMIVSDADKAKKVLNNDGVVVRICNVLAVAVNDEPGALMNTFEILSENKISVEYMYAFGEKLGNSSVIAIRTDDMDLAAERLADGGVTVLEGDDISEM
ncbi:MAG: ACT domain-containing protein [Monoglobaceae bacterium]